MPRGPMNCSARPPTHMNELDPVTAQRLQDHLQLLSVPSRTRALPGAVRRRPASPVVGRRDGRPPAGPRPAGRRRSGPPRSQRPRHARKRSQGLAGHVGRGAEEGRSGRLGQCHPRSIAPPRGSGHRRNQAVHRAEPPANRTGREEQPHPAGRRAAAAERRSRCKRSSP